MDKELKNLFDKKYSDKTLEDFFVKTKKMFEFFNLDFNLGKKKLIKIEPAFAKLWLNQKYKSKIIQDIEIFYLNLVYPKILSKIAITNLENFNEALSKLMNLYIKDGSKEIPVRKYINMTYGCILNPESKIYSGNIFEVPQELNKILQNILSKFEENIVYIDTDQIVFMEFDKIREDFYKYFESLNKFEISYYSKKSKFGFFEGLKKYQYEEDGKVKIVGFKNKK